MTTNGLLQIAIYFALTLAFTKPMGLYMARLFDGEITFLRPLERLCMERGRRRLQRPCSRTRDVGQRSACRR